MEIEDKKNELLDLIEKYLKSKITVNQLYEFSWETINFFSKLKETLPPYQEHERVFWYAIWQLQYLSDEEHEKDGSLNRALIELVKYLKNQQELPIIFSGKRP